MAEGPKHERYDITNADILFEDVWADDADDACPSCGKPLDGATWRCKACGQFLESCSGSCASCASPTCVGGKREPG